MTGHEQILKLRRAGRSPRTVWVNDFLCAVFGGNSVAMAAADVPEQQDWRFVVGLTVVVSSQSPERMARITAACGQFASRVIANLHGAQPTPYGMSYPILQITDTAGVFTWPA